MVKNTEKDGRTHCLSIKRGSGEGSTVLSFATRGECNLWKAVIETAAKSPEAKIRLRMRVNDAANKARAAWIADADNESGVWNLPPEETEEASRSVCVVS